MIRSLLSLIFFLLSVVQATAATVSVELSPTQQVAYEGVSTQIPAVVLVKRGANDSVADALIVNFSVSGTATEATDYQITGTTTATSITIPAGQRSASLAITPILDSDIEGQETVVIQLETGTGYSPTAPTSENVFIADNDVSVSLLTPNGIASEDYTPQPGTTLDPDVNRRGVFRTTLTPAPTFSTYVISELSAGGAVGAALLGTDYTVTYKIGGKGMGEGRGYTVQPRYAYLAGTTQIQVTGGSANITAGATITISGNSGSYSTVAGLAATSGLLTISPALTAPVSNGTSLTVSGATGFKINLANNWEPTDTDTLNLANGTGGFAVGDVFRIGNQTTPQYLVKTWTPSGSTSGALTFTIFTGTGGTTGGLAADLSGNSVIATHFPAVFSGIGGRQIQVLVPETSTRLEYGITPTSDTDVEASETLTMNLLTSNDYQTVSLTNGDITITDDDVVVSFNPMLSVNATEGGTNGSFRVVLSSAFPRDVDIAYTIGGTATPTTDYTPLVGTVRIPAGSLTGTITVIAADDLTPESTAETVVLTLQSTRDYRVITTSGATVNASAEISINDKIGVISIETVSGQTAGREHPTAVTTAAMVVTLRSPTTGLPLAAPTGLSALTIAYAISGTASNGSDYQTLTGSVVIPANQNQVTITVTPVDDTTPETSETVALTLSPGQGYTVSSTAGTASVSIADDEPIVAIGQTAATEGGASGVFTVGYLPPALNRDITVDLTYTGTAVPGDFTAAASSGTPSAVVIKAGELSSTVTIAAIDDTTPEGSETVIATITPKPAIYTVVVASATMNITDNEPVLKIVKVTDTAEGSDTAGSFRISYDTASVGRNIIVNLSYPTTTATARAADFVSALPTTVTIPSGTNTITFSTPLAIYDGIAEGFEKLECTIDANASSYTVDSTSGSATLTIADKIPTFTFRVDTLPVEGSSVYKGAFVITSNFKPLLPLTVNYTVTGDAKPGLAAGGTNDYKTLSGTVQVSELSTTIAVEAFADSAIDPLELVTVTLTNQTIPVFTPGEAPLKASMEILDAVPAVIDVTSTAVNNTTLTLGATAQIEVTFTQPMTVTGSPTLTIETGNNDTVATYNRISSDHYSLFFTYTVRASDTSINMDYAGTNALALQGATLLGIENVAATLTLKTPGTDGSLGAGQNRPINGGLDGGKPAPGAVGSASGGGCGIGSGLASLAAMCMLAGMMVSIRRVRR